jgi:hypothetical protein
MRHRTGRLLVAGLIGTGSVAWGLAGGLSGIAHAAAGGQQCEPLTAASSSPSATAANLCVSVQASQASVKRGQAASFTVEVFTQNGPASGVSVTLAAGPSGQTAAFTASCPGGNGAATCAVGSLATSVAPASYSMQAQIAVPASASSSVTSVTLTATADAAVSPAMAAEPATSGTVTVSGAASASPSPSPSPSKATTSTAPASIAPATSPAAVVSPVSTVALPTVPPVTLAPVPSTVLTPQDVASDLPTITPVAVVPTPATGTTGSSPVADTGSPQAGSFTLSLNMSAATAEVLGLIVVALALTMAGTKLVADVFNARRTSGPRPVRTEPAHSKPKADKPVSGTGGGGSTGGRAMFLRRSRPGPVASRPGAGESPAAPTQQIPGTPPEDIT